VIHRISILSLAALLLCGDTFVCNMVPAIAQTAAPVTFIEISSKESGISWVHNSAVSPERYLPETVGAGCAFFDYDNDGWIDIYLVNSGPSDFFSPKTPLKNALYHNNHDGTFSDATDKAGVAGGTSTVCAVSCITLPKASRIINLRMTANLGADCGENVAEFGTFGGRGREKSPRNSSGGRPRAVRLPCLSHTTRLPEEVRLVCPSHERV